MTEQIIGIGVLVVLAAVFIFGVTRAWRARSPLVKWPGVLVGGLIALVFTLVSLVAISGFYKLHAPHSNPVPSLQASASPAEVARAERLAHGCMGCHSS